MTVLDSPVLDWASGAAVSIFSGSGFFSAVVEAFLDSGRAIASEPETLVPLPRILGDLWPHAAPLFLGDLESRLDPGVVSSPRPGGGAPFSAAAIASEYFPNSSPIPQNFG